MTRLEIIDLLTGNKALTFYIVFALSFIINRLPYAGVFFRTVNTMLHESGHAIAAILTSGEVIKIEYRKDTSGLAQTKTNGRFSAFLTSFAGYPFAALASSILLILTINGQFKIVAFILLSLVILNLILFVRNSFGIIWLIIFSILLIIIMIYANQLTQRIFLLFVCMIAFTETIASTAVITFLGFTNGKKSGDMSNLKKITGVSTAFWSIMNLVIVVSILYYTVVNYFPWIKEVINQQVIE